MRKPGQYGHYLEQSRYIDSNYNIHILKLENMKEDFQNLMKAYSLNISFEKHSNKNIHKKYTVNSLSNEVINLINDVYHEDFKLFGYKKKNTT